MDTAPLSEIAPVVGQALNTAMQLVVARVTRRHGLSIGLGAVLGGVAAFLLTVLSFGKGASLAEATVVLGFNGAAYGALSFGYWVLINLNVTSVRVRLLRELLALGELARAELLARYDARGIAEARIERLLRYRQMSEDNGVLHLTGRAILFVALAVEGLKHVVLGRGSRPGSITLRD